MNQTTRTIVFLGAAAVSVGLAALTGWATRPSENLGGYEIGTPFFPDFDDPLTATALQVASFDEDAARLAVFKVEKREGIWQIPSHHNYPADGEDRLARTATSMLGVERGALVTTSAEDHKRYRVLDPMDETRAGSEGRGDRITLFQNDSRLLDLIIGDQVEDQTDVYYVRRADENQIYRAKLGTVDLSAKFADWIEQDLLQVNSSDLVEMMVDPYHIDEIQGLKIQDEDPILLERKPATSSWELAGIDESTEKEKVSVINAMSRALADLEIIGVRRKPQSLVALFSGEGDVRLTRSEQLQMQSAGFFVVPPGEFLANEGEVQAGTQEGVRYRLQFGEVFTGSEVEIEVGGPTTDEEPSEGEADAETGDEESEGDVEEDADAAEELDDSQQRSRYLFVSVVFDESLIGDRPQPPVPPTPPTETPDADGEDATGNEAPDAAADPDAGEPENQDDSAAETDPDGATDSDADASETDDAETPADTTTDEPETPTPQEAYEQALAEYEEQRAEYEENLAEYEEKVEAGQKTVEDLNRRYAEWYYVISADHYEDLKVSRADLVEPADPPDSDTDDSSDGPALDSAPADDAGSDNESGETSNDSPAAESSESESTDAESPEAESSESAPENSTPEASAESTADSSEPAESADPESAR